MRWEELEASSWEELEAILEKMHPLEATLESEGHTVESGASSGASSSRDVATPEDDPLSDLEHHHGIGTV